MAWFPIGRYDPLGWQLDVVSLLAILGESLMTHHIQPLSASKLCLLPRLLPAPQGFLRSARAPRLPSSPAIVCGVYSGTLTHELNYFADILHPIGRLKKYQVVVYNISWAALGRRQSASKEWPPPPRTETQRSQRTEALVPPRSWSPINILTLASTLLTLGAFIWAILIRDGPAVLALMAMSSASTLIGIAFHWRPQLAARPTDSPVPEGDVVIRTRDGAFIIVQCPEEIARELYMGPEECNYLVSQQWFSVLVGFGTLLVITGVFFLGNCNWTMQAVITVVYIVLNTLYWIASLLPPRWLWDLSRYDCEDVTPGQMKFAHDFGKDGDGEAPSYTRSLWYAIQATRELSWVTISGAAPRTAAWEAWLKSAEANFDNPSWNAVAEKDRLMREARLETSPRGSRLEYEEAPVTVPIRRETA